MPFPALAALLPFIGAGAAGLAGGAIGSSLAGQGNNQQPSIGKGGIGSEGSFWGGSPSRIHQLSRFSPQQTSMLNQLGQQGFQGLQNINPSFEPIAQQARENFGQRGIPSIAERFTNAGAQRSSAFGQSLGQGASDLESNLAALGSQFNQGQQGHYRSLLGLGLQPQFDTKIESAIPGAGSNLANSLAGGLGQSLPDLLKLLASYLGGNK